MKSRYVNLNPGGGFGEGAGQGQHLVPQRRGELQGQARHVVAIRGGDQEHECNGESAKNGFVF